VEVSEYLAADGSVVVLGWSEVPRGAPERAFVSASLTYGNLRDGKVVWFFNYVDTAALLSALGPLVPDTYASRVEERDHPSAGWHWGSHGRALQTGVTSDSSTTVSWTSSAKSVVKPS
jgi:hypothetical protein